MKTFERRQRILQLLRERSSVRVDELAQLFGVSKVTARNDLSALEEEGSVARVRGGAVWRDGYEAHSPAFAARAQVNASAKHRIARWAADMVRDGESIILDASTTVFHMIPWLQERRHLTVVTNSIEVGAALARNPSHTVILIGGILSPGGTRVAGHLAEKNIEELHVRTAFLSCTGFSFEAGLTQADIQDAQLKAKMVRSAERTVALVDSSKLGKQDLTPFASVEQISHLFTDSDAPSQLVERLRQAGVFVTVCGESTVSTLTPVDRAAPGLAEGVHYKIGFANISEDQSIFAVEVRHGLEQAAQRAGKIDLVEADNQRDGRVALKVADQLIAEGVNLVIEYQIDEQVGGLIASKFHQAAIPVIAVDIPMVGATFFGVDNYRAGRMAGEGLGRWIKAHWGGGIDRLIVLEEPRAGALPAARIQGQLDGLSEVIGPISPAQIIRLNIEDADYGGKGEVLDTLAGLPGLHRLAIICINDRAAASALEAAREAGREADVAIVSQGADRRIREEMRRPGSRLVGATAFWPERYGERLMEIALKVLRGEQVPPAVYIDHVFLHTGNISQFYPK